MRCFAFKCRASVQAFLCLLLPVVLSVPLRASDQTVVRTSFSLSDPDGKTVTQADFKGKWVLIYFGYTHCADLCPTELADMIDALRQMGAAAKRVQPIFITIDPQRDNGGYLRDYVAQFDDRLIGLGGTLGQVAAVAEGFGVQYDRVPSGGGSYAFKHASKIFALDPDGRYRATFAHMSDPYMIASKMLELLSGEQTSGAM